MFTITAATGIVATDNNEKDDDDYINDKDDKYYHECCCHMRHHQLIVIFCRCLWAASCYSRMLKHVTYITDFDPVSSEVMWALGSGCRDLHTLAVNPVQPW